MNTTKPHRNHIRKARNIAKTLGMHNAAKYLANRNWSLEAARWILLGL